MERDDIEERKQVEKRKAIRRTCAAFGIDIEQLRDDLIASWRSR